MIFQQSDMLIYLLLVPVLIGLFLYAGRRRWKSLREMYKNRKIQPVGRHGPRSVQAVFICLAVTAIVAALARPGWNPKMEKLVRESRDVIFLLDVSNSMHGRDRLPNRMENAKAMIVSCLDRLAEDQRVGLVVFAGSSSIACPLTQDVRFFLDALEKAGPTSVSQGGTRIGDALLKTADKLLTEKMRGFQDVVLISDGGDQESEPVKAVKALNDMDASLMVIGVGDSGKGVRIPMIGKDKKGQKYMSYNGQEVWSRLEIADLQEIVKTSANGLFLNAGTRAVNLADIYEKFVSHTEKKAIMVESIEQYDEGFFWFLGAALVLLMMGSLIPIAFPWRLARQMAVLVLLGSIMRPGSVEAAPSPESMYNQGNALFDQGDYVGAMTLYEEALEEGSQSLRTKCFYNLGYSACVAAEMATEEEVVEYERAYGFFNRSMTCFRAALDLDPADKRAAHNLELVRLKYQTLRAKEDQERQASQNPEENPGEENKEGESDSEEGTSDENEDAEYSDEESEGNPDESSRMPPSSSTLTDLENQSLPPPNLSPEDLLNEEILNNQMRDKRKRSKGRAVEKDW